MKIRYSMNRLPQKKGEKRFFVEVKEGKNPLTVSSPAIVVAAEALSIKCQVGLDFCGKKRSMPTVEEMPRGKKAFTVKNEASVSDDEKKKKCCWKGK